MSDELFQINARRGYDGSAFSVFAFALVLVLLGEGCWDGVQRNGWLCGDVAVDMGWYGV